MSSTLEILKELQAIAEREAQGDKYAHLELLGGLQRLQNAVATPAEKMLRIRFQMYQNVCVRIAQEYGILQALVAKGRASADDLSAATKVDALLIGEQCPHHRAAYRCGPCSNHAVSLVGDSPHHEAPHPDRHRR